MSVLVGECQVNGEPTIAGEPRKIRNGEGGAWGGAKGEEEASGRYVPSF